MNIRHWNSACNDWSRALKFYKEEIVILRHRLNEVAAKNTGMQVPAQVEHYENQFIIHTDVMERLLHNIQEVVNAIAREAENYAGFVNDSLPKHLLSLEQQYLEEEKLWLELRNAFYRFCSEWM